MSAFVVSKSHIDAIVTTANAWCMRQADRPDDLGRVLWTENVKSVECRYPDCTPDDLPGPVGLTSESASTYRWPVMGRVLTPVEALKAAACLEYQSCEHDAWETSDAHAFLEQFTATAITRLPGYEDAAWEVTR